MVHQLDDRVTQVVLQLVDRSAVAVGSVLAGPALIAEETAMTYLDTGYRASVHPTGSLIIESGGDDG